MDDVDDDKKFKMWIRKRKILAWIIKLTVPELRAADIQAVVDGIPSDDGKYARVDNTVFDDMGSTSVLDSVFSVEVKVDDSVFPVIVGVELQNNPSPAHALYTRMQYYAAKMLGRQVWVNSYDDLRQVYSVWILPDPLVRDRGKVRMLSVRTDTPDDEVDMTSMLNMVMVNLGVEVPV